MAKTQERSTKLPNNDKPHLPQNKLVIRIVIIIILTVIIKLLCERVVRQTNKSEQNVN